MASNSTLVDSEPKPLMCYFSLDKWDCDLEDWISVTTCERLDTMEAHASEFTAKTPLCLCHGKVKARISYITQSQVASYTKG